MITALLSIWCSVVLILGNLAFFLQRDWRLALLGLASCAGGALLTYRITRGDSRDEGAARGANMRIREDRC